MALKGFLASGFQKLIGASRIKGADESWLGEHNVQDVSSNTVPIAATLAPGLNIIRYTGGSDFDFTSGSSPLFSTTPTHATQVIFINKSVSSKKMTFESSFSSTIFRVMETTSGRSTTIAVSLGFLLQSAME